MYVVQAVNPSSTCIPTASIRGHSASLHMLSGSFSTGSAKTETAVQSVSVENVNLNIYPNPSNGMITVQMVSGEWLMENCEIEVYDVLGELVYSNTFTIHNSPFTIDLSCLSSGIYSLRMQTNNSITVKKLVVMKK